MASKRTLIVNGVLCVIEWSESNGAKIARLDDGAWQSVRVNEIGHSSEGIHVLFIGNKPVVAVATTRAGIHEITIHSRAHEVVADQRLVRRESRTVGGPKPGGPSTLKSTIAGMVVNVLKRAGDSVHSGETLLVIEAMKMQNEIRAPFDGSIVKIEIGKGDRVERGVTLLMIEPKGE